MQIKKIQLIGVAIMAICSTSLTEGSNQLPLVPYPQKIEFQDGSLMPAPELVFSYDKGKKALSKIAQTCINDFEKIGFSVSDNNSDSTNQVTIIELVPQANKSFGKEGYSLTIDTNIVISAATPDGIFWGTRTLLQLLQNNSQQAISKMTIIDKPEFEHRGLMIDNARNFHSLDFHIDTIKKLASYKLNRYQIHFSDDQSYTLPSEAFPDLPTKGRHYTKKQIKELVKVARQYHVMIVPEVDVPGHASALTKAIPKLKCTNIAKDKGTNKLCIGNEESYQVLETLFAEIMDMIPGKYWHLGADEVSYNGKSCTACAAKMKKENFKEGSQLFNYFINRMYAFVKSNDRKMLVWEGFSPKLEPQVNKEIIVCPFDVKHSGHMPKDYFNAGYKVLNTSWSPLYVADKIYMTTPEIIARWSPFMFGAGRSPQPLAYWKSFKPADYKEKIIGAQMCSWDNKPAAEEGLIFGTGPGFPDYGRPGPRIQIMAERVWTGSATSAQSLLERVGARYW